MKALLTHRCIGRQERPGSKTLSYEYAVQTILFITEIREASQNHSHGILLSRENYSAWSSVATLLKHELVARWSNPHKYKITDKVIRLAILGSM